MSGFGIRCVILAAFTQVSIGQTGNYASYYPNLNSSAPEGNEPFLPIPKPIPTPTHRSNLYYNHLISFYGQPPVSYALKYKGPTISETTPVSLNATSPGSTVAYTTQAPLTSTLLSSTPAAQNATVAAPATYTTPTTFNSTTQYSTSTAPNTTTVPPVNYTASVPLTLPPAVSTTAPITTTILASPTNQTTLPGDVAVTTQPTATPYGSKGQYGGNRTLKEYVVAQYEIKQTNDDNSGVPSYGLSIPANVTSTPSPPPQGDVGTTVSVPAYGAQGHYGDYDTQQKYAVAQYNMNHNNVTSTPTPTAQGNVGTTASAPTSGAQGHYGDNNTLQEYVVAQYNMNRNNVTTTPTPPQGDVGTTASAPTSGAQGHYGDNNTLQEYVVAQYNMNRNNVTTTPTPPQGDVGTTASVPHYGYQTKYETRQQYVAKYNHSGNSTGKVPKHSQNLSYSPIYSTAHSQPSRNHSVPSQSVPSFNDAYAAYINQISHNNNSGSTHNGASNYSQKLPYSSYLGSQTAASNYQYGGLGNDSAPGNSTSTPGLNSSVPKLSQYGYSNPRIQYDSLASFYGPLQTDHAGTIVGEGHDISMNPFGDDLVATESGLVQGVVLTSRGGHQYFAFRGIPYAEKPKRFRVARPVRPWTGVLDATDYGNMCPQIDPNSTLENTKVIGDEDCLNLNVFYPVPERCQDEPVLLPVLFHIHGGGFTTGAGQFYDPFFLMDECIVYVSINYRLGALGFVTTLDEQMPGNLGLKDSLLALQWVNDNIEFFRGNRYAITINGNSAGAVMVSQFIASPAAEGLFQRAISQSGSSLDTFGIIHNPVPLAFRLGHRLDCKIPSTAALRACLSTANVNDIVIQQGSLRVGNFTALQIGPVVEPADSQNAFQTTDPYLLFRSGQVNKVPVITGVMANEAFSFIIPILSDPTTVATLNENWLEIAPTAYDYDFLNLSSADDNRISEAIRSFYLNGTSINPSTMQGFIDSVSDHHFILGMHEEAVLYSAYSHVYSYVMTFVGSWSYSTLFGLPPTATHSDDVQYLFKTYDYVPQPQPGTREFAFSRQLIQLWVSFIKTGYPTALWPNVTKWREFEADDPVTLELGETTALQRNFNADRLSFWNGLGLRDLQFPGLA